MSDYSSTLEASEYQSHGRFVRRLARRLEADEAAAEDLAQDTWLAAIKTPPTQVRSMRAWLARVLRNKAAQRVRTAERRRALDESVARDELAADTAEIVERMELHRRVVAAVLELHEPYRSVLVRRFSQGETTAEIAAHLALPEPTVRTRLRRGLEQLRTRLRSEMGGTPALFLTSLRKLQGEPSAVPTAPPVTSSPATPLILTLLMKKAIVLTSLAAVALAVVWSVNGGGSTPSDPLVEAHDVTRAPELLQPAEGLESEPAPQAVQVELTERSEVAGASQVEPPVEAELADVADVVQPLGEVTIRIEDVHGNPIPKAQLHARHWRPVEEPGTSISWPGEMFMGESDTDGVVRLRYTKEHPWPSGTLTVGWVGYEVTHPDYITYEEARLDVAPDGARGETVVVLERGSFLIVSGWRDSPDSSGETMTDVTPHLSFDVDVSAGDWIPIGDGRPSCSRIPPGAHKLYLSHDADDGRVWYSKVTAFELVEGEQLELELQLLPPRSMAGMLSEDVLRPVTNGEVELNLYVGGRGDPGVMLRTYRVDVRPDGSFTFEGLPTGAGEIIGLCDGWVSARTYLADTQGIEPEGEGEQRRWQPLWELQQLDPAAHQDDPYVLDMEPTAHAEITVLDPDGEPIAGATVYAWPNIHWSMGYSSIFLDRTWRGVTGAEGVAFLENMPGEGRTFLGIQAGEGYRPPLAEDGSNRRVSVELTPGETARLEVRMEPPEEESD